MICPSTQVNRVCAPAPMSDLKSNSRYFVRVPSRGTASTAHVTSIGVTTKRTWGALIERSALDGGGKALTSALVGNIVEILGSRAAGNPAKTAFTFLEDGERAESSLTYAELDKRARIVSAVLQDRMKPGDRALLLYPPGLEFIEAFFGCLYAGIIAVPAFPPDPAAPQRVLPRINAIAADCEPTAILSTELVSTFAPQLTAMAPALSGLPVISTDAVREPTAQEWDPAPGVSDDIAFLQYTSGSTGTPKGVAVSHSNLLHNEQMIRAAMRMDGDSTFVSWLPLFHDMGLIGVVNHTVFLGAGCVLMSPLHFLRRPVRWLDTVSRYRATVTGGPNFAFELCLRKISDTERSRLDLGCLEVMFNGAEPVRPDTLERFAEEFAECGLRPEALTPCYGLAEATLIVSSSPRGRSPDSRRFDAAALEAGQIRPAETGRRLVSCGPAAGDQRVLIVDPDSRKVRGAGEVGEIWVSGPHVSDGYWARDEESEDVFRAAPVPDDGLRYLRTGDLGFLYDGELHVVGRSKDLVIVRGRNLAPQDLELSAERAHRGLRPGCCAVFQVDVEDTEQRLVAVGEFDPSSGTYPEAAIGALRTAVARDFEVELDAVVLLPPRTVPKTSSGKIQRRACRRAYERGELEVIAAWEAPRVGSDEDDLTARVENYITGLISERIGPDAADGGVGSIASLGVDSLRAAEIGALLENDLGVDVSLSSLLEADVPALARHIASAMAAGSTTTSAIVHTGDTGSEFPLSDNQLALWFLHERAPGSRAYNVATAIRVPAQLKLDEFQRAWGLLVQRHEALRTRFTQRHGTPYQQVLESRPLDFEHSDASDWPEQSLREVMAGEADQPFDLAADPLLRVRVYTRAPNHHQVLVVVHHIVTDFWSLALLVDELGRLYRELTSGRAAELPALSVRYADYVQWQARWLATDEAAVQLDEWAAVFEPEPAPLNLPTDRPRPPVQTERGGSCFRRLPPALAADLDVLARRSGVTLYTLLVTAFHTMLHRYTGQDDIVVGSPTAGRGRGEFAGVFGCFVNPVALRLDLAGDPRFDELLDRSRGVVLAALDRRRVPFMRIVERVQPRRDAGRSPLFQVMFVHQKTPLADPSRAALATFALGEASPPVILDGLTIESIPLDRRTSQFDLLMMVAEAEGELGLSLQFNADLFDPGTAERALGHFETLLAGVVADPTRRLSELPLLTRAERDQLAAWNDTARDYEHVGMIHQEFMTRAAERPDAPALSFDGVTLSYRQLDEHSNRLARYLAGLGVGRGSLVGIAAERSPELVVGLLGTMKAGAAYMPLDPEYPRERVAAMLADAAPAVVLTLARLPVPDFGGTVIELDAAWDRVAAEDAAPLAVQVRADDPAYVIFTSGSTGRPKGVVNTHGAIRNRLAWMQDALRLDPADVVLQKTPAGFDVSVWEFFWPLMTGARLVLARPGGHSDAGYLADVIERERVSTLHFVPSMLQLFLAEPDLSRCTALRRVICSGEALPPDLVRRFFERFDCELHNLYGPTEAAVDVTAWRCTPQDDVVPIGRAIANVRIHVLDRHGREVPVGVPGELHIGGVQVAAGYLGRPDLTRERFIPGPFIPAPYTGEPEARLYKTGDLARRRTDGAIEFLGRLDHQVKVHGNRIELGEIETRLAEHPMVREAVVVAAGAGADARLVGYLVAADDGPAPELDALRDFLGQRLPRYMIPSRFMTLTALPLTPSGKVDRRALPEPEAAGRRATRTAAPPRTPEEQTLARVTAEVLGLAEVGVDDNFFELGGDSIRALQVRVRAREAGLDISIPELLQYQTVEGLAAVARPAETGVPAPALAPFSLLAEDDRNRLPAGLVDAYPLTRLQEGLVFHSEVSPDYETYVMGLHLGGRFDAEAMRTSLARLVARHPLLRTSFRLTGFSEALQFVHLTAIVPSTVHDLRDRPADEHTGEILRFMTDQKWRKFDWSRAPLLRVDVHLRSDESFQCTFSHPLFDGWSMALLITELMTVYGDLARGKEQPATPPLRLAYADFVAMEREAIASPAERRFWAEHLADAARGELPRWPSRRRPLPSRHRRTEVVVDDDVRDGLLELARTVGASLKSVVLAAHLRVVSLLSGRSDVTTGLIANGRPEELDGDRVIGVFLNTIPLRMRLDGGVWRDLVRQVLAAERELLPHRRYPMADLVRTIGKGEQLFDTAFNYIHFHIYEVLQQVPDLDVLDWSSPSDQTYFPLTTYFHLDVSTSRLLLFLDVDDAVLDPEQVELIQAYYRATLAAMAANPDGRYEAEWLLPQTERHRQLVTWNSTDMPWPGRRPQGVHRRVAAQAALTPNATAVRCAGAELGYAELDRRANRLAHRLRGLGIGPGGTVGIALSRSADLPVALLGVLKAGAAYVPIDPGYPRPRLEHMLTDSAAPLVITESRLAGELPATGAALLCLDEEGPALAAEPVSAPDVPFDPEALAYVIYTSGSTGVPKGVEIPHGALDNFLLAMEELLGWGDGESLGAVTTLSFDIAGLELFLPLSTGGRLDLATDAEAGDPYRLIERLDDVTTMQATPATWRMLVDAGWTGSPGLRALCGGEALTAELAEAVRSRCRELWNVYGPTETTIWSTATRIDEVDGVPPIGRPLANTTCYVLDAQGRPVPTGAPGELYIGGLGLARGYRNRPDLTERAFVPDPFSTEQGARLYRTGDLVRRRPDGVLEYLARLDSQVKVRGFRIELGEIESVLGRRPEVRQAAVVARQDAPGDAQLVAYVVPRDGTEVRVAELRSTVAAALPAYMVPNVIVQLDELPLTPNGKVDRKALPAPAAVRPTAAGLTEPRTDLEARLAAIWRQFLKLDRIGIDDGFFELGGHSLLAVRIHARIREDVRDIPLTSLFEHPTIRSLAGYLADSDQDDYNLDGARSRAEERRSWAGRRRARRDSALTTRPVQE
jgi:amino acid adenylation domain-containing protein